MKRILLIEVMSVGILVAVLHKIALSLSLYWTVGWYDVMMHFLGGVLIALIALYVIYDKHFFNFKDFRMGLVFYFAVSVVLIVGLGWELWELYVGFVDVEKDLLDSGLDVVMDIFGSIAAIIYAHKKISNHPDRELKDN